MLTFLKKECDSGRAIVVFGAGEKGKNVIEILQKNDITVSYVCDNDKSKQKKLFQNYEVLAAGEIQNINNPIVIIASLYFKEIEKQLKGMGIDSIVIYKELFLKRNEYYDKLVFPYFANPQVSIILTAYNEWRYTYECLKTILLMKTNVSYEIIVGDNESTDETKNMEQYVENVTVIHNKTNLGYLRNCNETAKYAKGKYMILLSNDVKIISDYWMDKWVEIFEKNNSIGAVGGVVYEWNQMNPAFGYTVDKKAELTSNKEISGIGDVDYICPACICFRLDVWKEIGGYDERFVPAWYEDLDFYCEIRRHGYRVTLDASVRYLHYENVTYGVTIQDHVYQQNKEKFINKWAGNWEFVNASQI